MANTVVSHSPEILRWARERCGFTVAEVAERLKKTPETIEQWETGRSSPTYVQLETLAYSVYRRPVALFFLPAPPAEREPEQEFRSVTAERLSQLTSDTRLAIRQAVVRQMSVRELSAGRNRAETQIHKELAFRPTDEPIAAALAIRQLLGISTAAQLGWTTDGQAFREWRRVVEEKGVFVFKRPMKQKAVTGFCLTDEEFPIVYLSSSTTATHQIFTLLHELTHVLLSDSGITFRDSYRNWNSNVEVFCNRVAGEVLIPEDDFVQFLGVDEWDDEMVASIAKRYKVSRAAALHRALEHDLVSLEYFTRKAAQWAGQAGRETGGRSDYYNNQLSYAGETYLMLAFSRYRRGACTLAELADYVGVKVANIPKLEDRLIARGIQ